MNKKKLEKHARNYFATIYSRQEEIKKKLFEKM